MLAAAFRAERKPEGYRQLAVSSSVVDLADATGGIPQGATFALITVDDDEVRWRDDGGDPTSSVGMNADPSDDTRFIVLPSSEAIRNFKAIRVTTDAELNISYYSANKAY